MWAQAWWSSRGPAPAACRSLNGTTRSTSIFASQLLVSMAAHRLSAMPCAARPRAIRFPNMALTVDYYDCDSPVSDPNVYLMGTLPKPPPAGAFQVVSNVYRCNREGIADALTFDPVTGTPLQYLTGLQQCGSIASNASCTATSATAAGLAERSLCKTWDFIGDPFGGGSLYLPRARRARRGLRLHRNCCGDDGGKFDLEMVRRDLDRQRLRHRPWLVHLCQRAMHCGKRDAGHRRRGSHPALLGNDQDIPMPDRGRRRQRLRHARGDCRLLADPRNLPRRSAAQRWHLRRDRARLHLPDPGHGPGTRTSISAAATSTA